MENPYTKDYPKPIEMFMEVNTIRDNIRRQEKRLDQFENALVEFVERRHRNNAQKQNDVPAANEDAAKIA